MAKSGPPPDVYRLAGTDSVNLAMPTPQTGERPLSYSDRVGEWYTAQVSDEQRKARGLFLTPVQVANFMGARVRSGRQQIRLLDPAAGAGILCCAAVESVVSRQPKPRRIELVAYEIDSNLITPLQTVLDYLADWCRDQQGTIVEVRVEAKDFILANADAVRPPGLFPACSRAEELDTVIANPPYFKIGRSSPHAAAVPEVVHGQPNIYGLFMAVGAALLRTGGDFIFITPRSFTSGPYFQRFRTVFFDMIRPTGVHVFNSRRDAFRRDEVLQENMILCGTRHDRWHSASSCPRITVSSSRGVSDIDQAAVRELAATAVREFASADKILRLPVCDEDDRVLALVNSWSTNLSDMDLCISTGPVIPFRAADLVAKEGKVPASHAPLLWMNHVQAMKATWPLKRHKPEYVRHAGAEPLLVPNRNYTLLRRFSAKEEARRLLAAPWIASALPVPYVGLENHLNYIHRPGGTLSEDEAWGLAALYNSRLLDVWFRTINGNTQVSATELRTMPLPDHEAIVTLGRRVQRLADPLTGLDAILRSVIASPPVKDAAVG